MWHEKRRQQHRVYWRLAGGRDYDAFPTRRKLRRFIAQCKKLGRDVMVTAYRAAQFDPAGPTAIGLPEHIRHHRPGPTDGRNHRADAARRPTTRWLPGPT